MSFVEIPKDKANRLINFGPTILVSSKFADKKNIMTAAWCMPVSKKPPMLAVAIGPSRYSHDLIMQSKEFVVNIPGRDLLQNVWCCGNNSGRDTDKFSACGLSPTDGKHVQAPLVTECIGAIECRLDASPAAGDHTIMVGEVLAAWVKEGLFAERLLVEKAGPLHHLGGREFCLPGEIVEV